MRKFTKLLILLILFSGCANKRYLLIDRGKDKYFLINYIKKSAKNGEISKKPLIVVDGAAFGFKKELIDNRLLLSKNNIKEIEHLEKEGAINIYGDNGKPGVLLISTKSCSYKSTKSIDIDKCKVLILFESKVISKSDWDKIPSGDVESIDLILEREKIMKYTFENIDGLVIVHKKLK